jgi:hypothetical protein
MPPPISVTVHTAPSTIVAEVPPQVTVVVEPVLLTVHEAPSLIVTGVPPSQAMVLVPLPLSVTVHEAF